MTGSQLRKVFEAAAAGTGSKVADAYNITADNDSASRKGAVDFIGDARFNWPILDITQQLQKANVKVHRHIFDQVNPFAKKDAIAHHAVDLLAIFAAYDDVVGEEMQNVGKKLRANWITFAHGEEPWTARKAFGYGPDGKTGELSNEEASSRRREKQFAVLKEVGFDTYQEIWWALLAAGATAMAPNM